ncbi:csrA Carbon storage regulator [uncultured Caudovirales phage]|uniref:CsrA Carbon storage regulator n=1 Tax=uncultured Caudovirales phage TaxID=2100421 RepID=A0A6J7WDE5_9CAUD|nr:csrA Carbon storage regulator [uncultured Caudovirales phage]
MLMLSRTPSEGIVISDRSGNVLVRMTVTEMIGNKVKIGFVADQEIVIDRDEVWRAKEAKKSDIYPVKLTEPGSSD